MEANKKEVSGILELEMVEEYGTLHGVLNLYKTDFSAPSLHKEFDDFIGERVRISIELIPDTKLSD